MRIVQSAPSKLSSLSLRWSCPLSFYNVSPKLYILFSRIISFLFLSFSSSPAWRLLGFSDALSGFHLNCLNWPPPALPCSILLCSILLCTAQPRPTKATATDPLLPHSQQSTLERSESPLHTPYSLRLRACQAGPNRYPILARYPTFFSIPNLTRFISENHWVSGITRSFGYTRHFWQTRIPKFLKYPRVNKVPRKYQISTLIPD